jgi:hypothetical protein
LKEKLYQKNSEACLVKFFACKKFVYNVGGRPEWEMEIKEYSDMILKAVGMDEAVL